MYKYLFRQQNPIAKFVRKQYQNYKFEEYGYISAFLASYRNQFNQIQFNGDKFDQEQLLEKTYDKINSLELEEQIQLSTNDHLEQLFFLFDALNKASGNNRLVLNKRYEELSKLTDLVDPNKFPIFSLIEVVKETDIVSIWKYKPEFLLKAQKLLGFSLEVKQSSLEHHEAGDGVFLKIDKSHSINYITRGTLLGLVPGVIYDTLQEHQENKRVENKQFDSYLHRFDDLVIDFKEKVFYPNSIANNLQEISKVLNERQQNKQEDLSTLYNIPGDMINPYAIGHKINHCKPEQQPNAIYVDMFLPLHFFGEEYLKFLPNLKNSKNDKKPTKNTIKQNVIDVAYKSQNIIRTVGIFALREINDGEELFVNYFDCNMFEINELRDWLVIPPPHSPYYQKEYFENQFTVIGKFMEALLFRKHADVYQQFQEKVKHDISRHQLEEDDYYKKYIQKNIIKSIEK